MKIKAYITGICGFVGSWLAEELLSHGHKVMGAALPDEPVDNLLHVIKKVSIDRYDITNPAACKSHLIKARPDYIFHLAAVSSVGQSFSLGELTFRINVNGTYNIFEAIRSCKWLKKIIHVSSCDVYGPVRPKDLPLKPDKLFNPVSPYAQSKAATEYLARMYIDQYNLPLVIARPFNHTGPRQNANFVIPSFCRQIVKAEKSSGPGQINVGNLAAARDISDVRDIVRGYRLLAEKGKIGNAYHLCSGRAFVISDLLNKLIGFSDIPIKIKRNKKLLRDVDIPILRGSYRLAQKDTGWKPKIKIDTTLRDTLEFWRKCD
jgi:GDP-4-dehydro-6-deoxy-D-mannose reductase